jgi:hypothetical protein
MNNARRKACGHFKNKNRENMKHEVNKLAMNSKNKSFRDQFREIN